jgi:3-oxoacyl-[acyl-carrier protein] reductase
MLQGRISMDLGLTHRVALVAGGSSGLGRAIATELAREGADVVICARDPARLAAAEVQLRELSKGRVIASQVDLEDEHAARRWVDDAAARMGRIDIVVTNSGSPPIGPPSAFAPDDYRRAVDRVLHPPIALALAVLPYMKAGRWGRILFLTSEAVHRPIANLTLSGVARSGLVRFAEALVAELGASGITVNVLASGYMRTRPVERLAAEMAARAGTDLESQLRVIGDHIPIGRIGDPGELASIAAFLVSERAAFVTGTLQLVDGGAAATGGQSAHLTTASRNVFV